MPNPTTAKSASSVYLSSGLGANVQTYVGCTELLGPPTECIANVLGQRLPGANQAWDGVATVPTNLSGGGPMPAWTTAAIGGLSGVPVIESGYSAPPLVFPAPAFSGSGNIWTITARTFFAVFAPRMVTPNTAFHSGESYVGLLATGVDTNKTALGYTILGNPTNGAEMRLGLMKFENSLTNHLVPGPAIANTAPANSLASMILRPDHFVAVALVVGEVAGSTKFRQFFLYDYATQQYDPFSGQGGPGVDPGLAPASVLPAPNYLTLNPAFSQQYFGAFRGRYALACAGTANVGWTAANFATFVADPFVFGRGTPAAGGGAVVVGAPVFHDSDNTRVIVAIPRIATGLITNPTADWYGGTGAIAPPGTGTHLNSLTGVTAVDTGNSHVLVDARPALVPTQLEIYEGIGTDGTTTANTASLNACPMRKPTAIVLRLGDSLLEAEPSLQNIFEFLLQAKGYRVRSINRGYWGSTTANWLATNNTSQNQTHTIAITNGTPTSGGFTLFGTDPIGGQTGNWSIPSFPFNSTAAAAQTFLNSAFGAIGSGSPGHGWTVAVTGTTLPAGPLTVVFSGSIANTQFNPIWADPTNGGSGGLAGGTQVWTGTLNTGIAIAGPIVSIGTGLWGNSGPAQNLLNASLAEGVAQGANAITLRYGSNDCNTGVAAATYIANMSAIIAYVQSYPGLAGVPIGLLHPTSNSTMAGAALVNQYHPLLDALASPPNVYVGLNCTPATYDTQGQSTTKDGAHPTFAGAFTLASEAANLVDSMLYPAAAGGATYFGRGIKTGGNV
jgi:hypothetical protein